MRHIEKNIKTDEDYQLLMKDVLREYHATVLERNRAQCRLAYLDDLIKRYSEDFNKGALTVVTPIS